MPICKFCGKEIVWMKTKGGKNIPVIPSSITTDNIEVYNPKFMKCHFDECTRERQPLPFPKETVQQDEPYNEQF